MLLFELIIGLCEADRMLEMYVFYLRCLMSYGKKSSVVDYLHVILSFRLRARCPL